MSNSLNNFLKNIKCRIMFPGWFHSVKAIYQLAHLFPEVWEQTFCHVHFCHILHCAKWISFWRLGITSFSEIITGVRQEKRKICVSLKVTFCAFLPIAEIIRQFIQDNNNIFLLWKQI